ncbi:hypothetical protein HJFPF1_03654 [Paramyrothecium foliicola]|nr:hypothetical protein HJFPF1_03654 [Paramyrothecium foliicola]
MAVLPALWLALLAISVCAQQSTMTVTRTAGGGVVTRTTIQFITTPSAPVPVTTHTINVGANTKVGHKFTPEETTAEVGDIIEWRFYPAEHWVIRGDFDHLCIPYEYVGINRQGFSSGPKLVNAIIDDASLQFCHHVPKLTMVGSKISCSCVTYHMLGVINPTSNMSLSLHLEKAEQVDYQLRPGEPWPTEGDVPDPSPTSDAPDTGKGQEGKSLGQGEIAGIAIGAAAVLVLAAGLCYLLGRRRRGCSFFGGRNVENNPRGSNAGAEGYPRSFNSPTAEQWSQKKFSFGTQGDQTQRQPSPMPTIASQTSPISPGSTAQHYPFHFPTGVGSGHGNNMTTHW